MYPLTKVLSLLQHRLAETSLHRGGLQEDRSGDAEAGTLYYTAGSLSTVNSAIKASPAKAGTLYYTARPRSTVKTAIKAPYLSPVSRLLNTLSPILWA